MDDVVDQDLPASDGAVDEQDLFTDLLMEHWLGLAAVAWDGFSARGRGVVVLTEADGSATLAYQPGPPCPCHAEMVEEYDPEHQVVVVHRAADEECCINVFGGWPTPPDAAASVPAADRRVSIH